MTSPAVDLAPRVDTDQVRWRIPVAWAPDGVRLEVDWVLEVEPVFVRDGGSWTLRLPRPAATRFDYRLVLLGSGHEDPVPDPTNPRRLRHPFGDRSEIRFPDYVEPTWLDTPVVGRTTTLTLPSGALDRPVPTRLWSPAGLSATTPAPLLVVHDGTDLAENGSLLAWAARHAAQQPLRVALLDAPDGCRDAWYAANPAYGRQLAEVVLPALRRQVSVSSVVGLGASLGGLALLCLQRAHPEAVDALVLQSGTFLTPDLDPQEAGYASFDRVCAAVAEVTARPPARVVPTLVTCGAIEENLANNRRIAEVLTAQGYPLVWAVVPDAHTLIGWRDAWSPHLDTLVRGVA